MFGVTRWVEIYPLGIRLRARTMHIEVSGPLVNIIIHNIVADTKYAWPRGAYFSLRGVKRTPMYSHLNT